LRAEDILIADVQSAVDLMMSMQVRDGDQKYRLSKNRIADRFFILRNVRDIFFTGTLEKAVAKPATAFSAVAFTQTRTTNNL
jgi:hypothetical protein